MNFSAFMHEPVTFSSLGLSNGCAQSGHSTSVAFADNVSIFFARKFSPFQGVANVKSNS